MKDKAGKAARGADRGLYLQIVRRECAISIQQRNRPPSLPLSHRGEAASGSRDQRVPLHLHQQQQLQQHQGSWGVGQLVYWVR